VRAAPEMAQGDDEHDNADAVAGEAHCPAPIRGHKPGNTPPAQRPSDRLAGPADSDGEAAHVLADDAVFETSGGRRQGKASLSYVLWQLIRRLSGRASRCAPRAYPRRHRGRGGHIHRRAPRRSTG
jgi:hypothetical protein